MTHCTFFEKKYEKTWEPFRKGSHTLLHGLRGTRFPLEIPSPQARKGIEKSGAGAPEKVGRIWLFCVTLPIDLRIIGATKEIIYGAVEVIGDAILGKRMNFLFRMIFIAIGAIIYYMIYTIVLWLKMDPNMMKLFTAVIVAICLAVPYLKNARKSSFHRAGKNSAGGKKNA